MSKKVKSRKHALKRSKVVNTDSSPNGYLKVEHPHSELVNKTCSLNKPREIRHSGSALMSSLFEEFYYNFYVAKEFSEDAKSTRLMLGELYDTGCVLISGKVSALRKFGHDWKLLVTSPVVEAQCVSVGYRKWREKYVESGNKAFKYLDGLKPFDSHVWISLGRLDGGISDNEKVPFFIGDRVQFVTDVTRYRSGVTHRYGLADYLYISDARHSAYSGSKTVKDIKSKEKVKIDKYLARLASADDDLIVTSKLNGSYVWTDWFTKGGETYGFHLGYLHKNSKGHVRFKVNLNRNHYVTDLLKRFEDLDEVDTLSRSIDAFTNDWLYKFETKWVQAFMGRLCMRPYYALLYDLLVENGFITPEMIAEGLWRPTASQRAYARDKCDMINPKDKIEEEVNDAFSS